MSVIYINHTIAIIKYNPVNNTTQYWQRVQNEWGKGGRKELTSASKRENNLNYSAFPITQAFSDNVA